MCRRMPRQKCCTKETRYRRSQPAGRPLASALMRRASTFALANGAHSTSLRHTLKRSARINATVRSSTCVGSLAANASAWVSKHRRRHHHRRRRHRLRRHHRRRRRHRHRRRSCHRQRSLRHRPHDTRRLHLNLRLRRRRRSRRRRSSRPSHGKSTCQRIAGGTATGQRRSTRRKAQLLLG